jgi:EmrB/QacA subfamily drug resistance transporter
MQVPTQKTQQGGGLPYKWIVAIVVIFGLFMSILDATIVNIAIPRLQTTFGVPLSSVQWVSTAYTLAQGVATPLTPFLSERLGLKRLYLLAVALFTIGSAFCGLAWSLEVLIFFRVLQGAAGACLFPLSITMLYREFPPQERGTAIGTLGIPILIAPALGPTLGGYIVTYAGWQLIFYINLPIGILGVVLGLFLLHEYRPEGRSRFDIPGFVFSAVGLASLLYALSDASTDGWSSSKVLGFLVGGLLALVIFVVVELVTISSGRQPLLDLRIFANGPFATANIANVLVTFALFGGLFLVPIYLQVLRGQTAYEAGLLLLPQAMGSMVAVVIGGRLVDRLGVKPVVIPGLAILTFALWRFSFVTLNTPFWEFQVLLILRGLGLGLCAQPLTIAALVDIGPRQLTQANSLNAVVRFISSSLGVAVLATLVQTQTTVHYVHLAEGVTADSPIGQLVQQQVAFYMARGASLQAATAAAVLPLISRLQQQAYMLAINDAFLLSVALAIIATIAVIFIRTRPRAAAVPTKVSEEEKAALEEAKLAL